MPKVQILSPDVISKIAAGEVIERPASVIKELVENSIDAGATNIEVHLKDAGKQLIHIKDNGRGITPEDLQNLFQRHATSKITAIDDLENLHSLGFRGEALYSIAAISDVVLRSQPALADSKNKLTANRSPLTATNAWEIHIRGGKRVDFKPAAVAGHGTDIKISDLFFNTPARKKFLKSNTTELNQVLNVFIPYTLLYPNVRFLLTHAGRPLIDLSSAATYSDRMAHALNVESKHLIEHNLSIDSENIRIKFVLGDINLKRSRKDLQYIFVNDRPVQNRNIAFNLNDVYRLIFPPQAYPCFAIFITIDPAEVDANIHPTKREVKIRNEQKLIAILRHSAEQILMTQGDIKTIGLMHQDIGAPAETLEQGITADTIIFGPGQIRTGVRGQGQETRDQFAELFSPQELTRNSQNTLKAKFERSRYVGSFMNKYLLWESAQSLLIVDQHAAQERIMYEKFRKQIADGRVEIQHLLTPMLLKLTPQEFLNWEETEEDLKKIGLETTQLDNESIAVHTQPVILKNVETVVRALLAQENVQKYDHDSVAKRACKASIKAGDHLHKDQAEFQRKELLSCENPFTCPHGRPTVIEITDGFLEKEFLRT